MVFCVRTVAAESHNHRVASCPHACAASSFEDTHFTVRYSQRRKGASRNEVNLMAILSRLCGVFALGPS
ncbi:hypothetical protein RB195_004555 [Necator americanus]|uniref:Uncharacterized protein n=1 Tax=Necator americanus TaxID=51031 RepID=A0ABR1BIL1_NECAM